MRIKAVAINGLLSPLERQDAIERVEKGDVQLLYLSPESLRSPTILRILNMTISCMMKNTARVLGAAKKQLWLK